MIAPNVASVETLADKMLITWRQSPSITIFDQLFALASSRAWRIAMATLWEFDLDQNISEALVLYVDEMKCFQ